MSSHSSKRRKISPENDDTSENPTRPMSMTRSANEAGNGLPGKQQSMKSKNGSRSSSNGVSAEVAFTGGLYKSSFFKLQMDELLTDLRPNYEKQGSRAHEILHKLKEIIENLAEKPPQSIVEAEKELQSAHGVAVPFPNPRPSKDAKYLLAYSKPANVNVVGSFALRTGVRDADCSTIDLAVTMPDSLFQEKDYVNYRYFYKRAYYVACIAAGIREAKDLDHQVKFEQQDGDSLRPVIVLEPTKDHGSSMRVRIITAIDNTVFPISRTLPMKNNIRQGALVADAGEDSSTATMFYNAALRSDASVAQYHKVLYLATTKCTSFRDACILGRTWLRQRGFGSSFHQGGFGGFEWAIMMALLFEGGGPNGKPVLLPSYSSYQLFKAMVQFITAKDFTKPLTFFNSEAVLPHGQPILYDGKRGLNLLYKMTLSSYTVLRHEAGVTLRMLNESRDDNFERVFILKVDEPLLRFDRVISIRLPLNGDTLQSVHHQTSVHKVLLRALGDRVKLVSISGQCIQPWSVGKRYVVNKESNVINVGLIVHSENSMRVVDHGPLAEEKEETASFRSFWGDKSELRRFKDGSILESLVWSDGPSAPSIIYQIVTYVLHRHFNLAEEDMVFVGDEYDEKLRLVGDGTFSYSDPSFQQISNAFHSLERSFHNMEDIPLTIKQLLPASPLLRYAALQTSSSSGSRRDPMDIVLQFESSGRWPDDLSAIQMTKVAFLVKIGEFMETSGAAVSTQVGVENDGTTILNTAFLDILHTSGLAFRLRIHHDREQTLLERELKGKSNSSRSKGDLAYALSTYKRIFVQAPRLTQAIRNLCTRFPLLSPTMRLVKHWFNCHLLTAHFSEEVIELLTVRTFTQPYPWEAPSSVMAGFFRTLHFISRWDWQEEPAIVNLGGGLDQSTVDVIKNKFSAWRCVDPAMNTVALFAASDLDIDGVTWTQYGMPPKVVAARLSSLAKAAMKLLKAERSGLDLEELFDTSMAPYDFVIRLNPTVLRSRSSSSTKFKNLTGLSKESYRPSTIIVSFVQELQSCFGNSVLLFQGDEQSTHIAGLWNPQMANPKPWSLKVSYSTIPRSYIDPTNQDKDTVSINRGAILNEIARLGENLIQSIDVRSQDSEDK
ncbi:hypothetical protein ASPZODRAFT_918659 [Penicilliopsis zonata CBS 506.65]|uniref:U3 small nucleolar RNA-associated protein 22 n=1 Tax=Penicilliopsis zonata CBS 506.65 TaxID=1073090 RepID=A0A1L9S858_9EURO|nr:hypothetical protein ASPZODRAFT_918659 [Penicilliopsis zonata CBS 506.65]OJJ43343.1 hypothetical protein ASPZODRAFT_918659 [Penicilliopsis zonata CBS 506.65]